MHPKICLEEFDYWKERTLAILQDYVGEDNPIGMAALTEAVFEIGCANPYNDTHARLLRKIIDALQREKVEICSTRLAGGGYFLAATPEQFQKMIKATKEAALKKLGKAAHMSRVTLPVILGQLALEYCSTAALEIGAQAGTPAPPDGRPAK